MATQAEIAQNYQTLFGRAPDEQGAAYWASTGLTGQALQNAMLGGAAPEDLRSAVNNAVSSGISGAEIGRALIQAGVTPERVVSATGLNPQTVNQAFTQAQGLLTQTPAGTPNITTPVNTRGGAGGYGFVNGLPVLSAQGVDTYLQQLGGGTGKVQGAAHTDLDDAIGWDLGSSSGFVLNGAAITGLGKTVETTEDGATRVTYTGDFNQAAQKAGINPANFGSQEELYNAINEKLKDTYVIGGAKREGITAVGEGNNVQAVYKRQGNALVPVSQGQAFTGIINADELEKSGFRKFAGKVAPIAGIALLATGAGSALGGALLGAGSSATAAGALGGALIGGGVSAATGNNVLQGAALGAIGGGLQGAYSSGALQSTLSEISGVPLDRVNSIIGAGGGNTGSFVNQVFDDGSVLVTNSAGQIVGGIDTAGQAFGNITAQVFDDGSRLLTGANGQVIGGVDTAGGFFNGQNAISTVGGTGVQSGGAGQYAGTGAGLGGTAQTSFGGGLGTVAQAGALTGAGAAAAGAGGAGAAGNIAQQIGRAIGGNAGNIATGLMGAATNIGAAAADRAALERYGAELQQAAARFAPQMQFQPIGITTRFGSTTTPQYDANGRLIGFGYTPAADIAAQRDRLLTLSNEALPTTVNTEQATADYLRQLEALQRPADEQTLAGIQSRLQATGRGGLAFGATSGAGGSTALAATNPELAAFYNAQAQRQAQQALSAQDIAQQRLARQLQLNQGLFGQALRLEEAAQQPLTLGTQLGGLTTAGSTNAARAQLGAAASAAELASRGAMGMNAAVATQAAGLTPYIGRLVGGLFGDQPQLQQQNFGGTTQATNDWLSGLNII